MANDHHRLEAWKPGVPKSVLLFIAGAMWLGVGIMLEGLAASWLEGGSQVVASMSAGVGIISGNLARIRPMEGKRCLFAFMPLKSYFLVALMIAMGMALRHSPLPKVYLAAIYLCMGTAMVLSSLRYFRELFLKDGETRG